MSDQLTRELIDRLAEVLGTAGPHVYAVMVRQNVVRYQLVLVSLAVWFALNSFIFWRLMCWFNADIEKDSSLSNKGNAAGVVLFGTVTFGALSAFALVVIMDSILHITNPEYYVIMEILKTVRGK